MTRDRAYSNVPTSATRRDFLHQAAGLTAGVAALAPVATAESAASASLPTIRLGSHMVTRLILGVGMYQQFSDQVGANVALVHELCAKNE